jgi:hypothetical protein
VRWLLLPPTAGQLGRVWLLLPHEAKILDIVHRGFVGDVRVVTPNGLANGPS